MTKLVVIGQGYVGLPMALRAAEVGLSVIGLDTKRSVVDALNEGRSPVHLSKRLRHPPQGVRLTHRRYCGMHRGR